MSQIKYLDESGLNVYDHEIKKYIKDKSHVVLPFKISKNTNDSTLLNVSCSGLKSKKIQNILETIYNNPNSFILLNLDIEDKGRVKVIGSVNIIETATVQVIGSFNYDADHITVDVKFKRIENSWEIIEQVGLISACPKLDDSTGKIAEEYMPEKIDMAKDLTGVIEATPEEFNFRPSAGDKSIRDESAVIRRIKGNSLVWNSLVKNNIDIYAENGWGSRQGNDNIEILADNIVKISFNSGLSDFPMVSQRIDFVDSHKYLIKFKWNLNSALDEFGRAVRVVSAVDFNASEPVQYFSENFPLNVTKGEYENIYNCKSANYIVVAPRAFKNDIGEFLEFSVTIIDLTKMFGAGNEPSTIEEFYAHIPSNIDIYAYNEGEIINNNVEGIKTVGFNQWDEEWELGYLNSGGTSAPNYVQNYIRAKNYIPVIAGKKYFAKLPEGVRDCQLYSVDKNFKLVKQIYPWDNSIFTIPEGASYIRFYLNYGGEVYNNDICINLSDESKNGTYEPYRSTTKDLSFINKYFPNGMRKAGSVYDEILWDNYNEKWKAIQRVGVVDLGSLDWTLSNDTIFKSTKSLPITDLKKPLGNEIIGTCARYVYVGQTALSTTPDSISIFQSGRLWINDGHYTDAASLKESLQGVMLYYELKEPIETIIEDAIQLDYKVDDFGTEEIISSKSSAPFSGNISYKFNAVDRILYTERNVEVLNSKIDSQNLLESKELTDAQKAQVAENLGGNYQNGIVTYKEGAVEIETITNGEDVYELPGGGGKLVTEEMAVKDLTGVIEATPEEFNFRPSAGDKSIRDESAVIRRIKGNSFVWNQLAHEYGKGLDVDKWALKGRVTNYGFDNGILSIVFENSGYAGVSQKVPNDGRIRHNDKILNIQKIRYSGDKELRVISPYISVISTKLTPLISGEWSISWSISTIPSYADLNDVYIGCRLDGTITSGTLDIEYSSFYNLTKMFGSGNEPSTIEEFYARIPQGIDIYSYNEGEIINNNVVGIKTVGFNQWDEEWELSSTGEYIVSKNFCKAIPNTDYYIFMGDSDGQINLNWYDSSYKVIRTDYSWKTRKFKSPERASFFKLRFYADYGTTYKHDICINLSHSGVRNGEYEPYKENYRALPDIKKYFPDGMKSAGSVYDEITSEKAIQRVGVVDLGTLAWDYYESIYGKQGGFMVLRFPEMVLQNSQSEIPNLICTSYPTCALQDALSNTLDKTITGSKSDPTRLIIYDSTYSDNTTFRQAMQGVMLYYELAEPIETPLEEPIQLDYVVEDWGTEEAISEEPSTHFKADIVYQFNAEGRIRDNSRNIEILENTTVKSIPQSLSEDQKKQVRENIGAAYINDSKRLFKYHRVPMTEDDGSGLVYLEETEEDRINNVEILNWIFSNGFENADPSELGLGVVAIATQDDSTEMLSVYLVPTQMNCFKGEDGELYYTLYSGNFISGVGAQLVCSYSKPVNEEWKVSGDIFAVQLQFASINSETGKIDEEYLPEYDVEVNPTLKFDIIENTSSIDEYGATIGYLSDNNYHYHNVEVLNYITDHQDVGVKMIIYIDGKPIYISTCNLNIDNYVDKKNYNITGSTVMEQAIYILQCTYEKVDNIYTIDQNGSILQYFLIPLLNLNTGKVHSDFLPEYDVEINPTLKFIVDENQQTDDPSVAALSEENYVEHNRKVLNYIKDKKDKALHVVIDINPKGDSNIVSIQCAWAFDSPTDDLILFGETVMGYTKIILSGIYHNFSTDPVLSCSVMQDEMNYVRYNENGKIDSDYLPEYDVEVNPTLKFDIIEDTSSVDESVAIIGYLSDENYHEHNIKVLNYITDHQDVGVKTVIYNNDNGQPICISCMLNIDDYDDKKNYIITGYTPIEQSIYTIACLYEKVDNIYTFNQSNSDLQYYEFPLLNLNTRQMHSAFLPTNKLYFTMNTTDNTVSQNTLYSDSNIQMISDIYSKRSSLSDIEVNAVLESTSSDVLYKLCLSNITKNENGMNLTFTSGNYIALLVELLNNELNDGFEFGNINISNNNPL